MSIQNRIQRLQKLLEIQSKKLHRLQSRRLTLGLSVTALLILSQIFKGFYLELVALFMVFPSFLYFFTRSRRLSRFIEQLGDLERFYMQQVNLNKGVLVEGVPAEEMHNPDLARDLDLGVFFANINTCSTYEGEALLNQWLCQDFAESSYDQRRNFIIELCKTPGLLRRLQLTPMKEKASLARIRNEVERSFFARPLKWKTLVPLLWMSLLGSIFLPLPSLAIKISFFLYAGAMLVFLRETNHLFSRLQDIETDLNSLSQKIIHAEKLAAHLSHTPELKKHEASKAVSSLRRLISLMSVKTNPILFYILNLLLPWDYMLAELSERSRKNLSEHLQLWSEELAQLEACGSLANLKIYHQTTWPVPLSEGGFVSAQELSHPLLDQDTVVTNDFSPGDQRIFIITGSNMSGKSTFLRAMGINFCLANIGAPVFAGNFSFKSCPLVSCIRVSDSLRDGQSYFYAEVQRMKRIWQESQKGPVFFLIDEPLRGTNNRERLIGNKSYLNKMLENQAYGFISTHDLELTQLANEDPSISNAHFSEKWENNTLSFDYKIKTGPSQSTNALKILAQEELFPLDQV